RLSNEFRNDYLYHSAGASYVYNKQDVFRLQAGLNTNTVCAKMIARYPIPFTRKPTLAACFQSCRSNIISRRRNHLKPITTPKRARLLLASCRTSLMTTTSLILATEIQSCNKTIPTNYAYNTRISIALQDAV